MSPRSARPLAFLSLIATGCQLVGGYETFDYETKKPPSHACSALPTAKDDALGIVVMSRVDFSNDTCIWMDRTEVTVEQYERWQGDVPPDEIAWEPTWCDWKEQRNDPIGNADDACVAELLPFDLQPFAPTKPMRCVDFCEAEAFCRWSDKHLCYDAEGIGSQGPRGVPQEWRLACTNQLTTRYPWGNEAGDFCHTRLAPESCIDSSGRCGPVTVGRKADCVTPGGIVDLLGNVAEWVFSCNFVDSQKPLEPSGCLTRGGSYDEPLVACDAQAIVANDVRKPSLGFRCCANLTTDEEILVGSTRR